MVLLLMVEIDPTTDSFFWVPYPIITVSLNEVASKFNPTVSYCAAVEGSFETLVAYIREYQGTFGISFYFKTIASINASYCS